MASSGPRRGAVHDQYGSVDRRVRGGVPREGGGRVGNG